MDRRENSCTAVAAIHADAPAEHLFFAQYRYWMAGYSTRDTFCWDCAWDAMLRFVGQDSAKALFGEFHLFTRILSQQARRNIEWRPDVCRCLCRDEFLALRLVAASQQNNIEEEISVATNLLYAETIHALLKASRSLAQALKDRRFVLAPIKPRPISIMPHAPRGHTLQ